MPFSGFIFGTPLGLPFEGFLGRFVFKKLAFRLGRLSKTLLAPKSPAKAKPSRKVTKSMLPNKDPCKMILGFDFDPILRFKIEFMAHF